MVATMVTWVTARIGVPCVAHPSSAMAMPVAGAYGPAYAWSGVYSLQSFAEAMTLPWVSAALMILGMALIVIAAAVPRGAVTGVLGVACIGSVMGSASAVGMLSGVGTALLISGGVLFIMEAKVIRGRGACALGGVVCVFVGCAETLATSGGALIAYITSALVSLMSVVALLAYISRDPEWESLYDEARRSLSRSPVESHRGSVVSRVDVKDVSEEAHPSESTIAEDAVGAVERSRRLASAAVDRGLSALEDTAVIGSEVIDRLGARLSKLQEALSAVASDHARVSARVETARKRLAELEDGARDAAEAGDLDLAADLVKRRDRCRAGLKILCGDLASARARVDDVRAQMESAQATLADAQLRVQDAATKERLAGLIGQTQRLMQEEMGALSQMMDRMDQTCAEGMAAGDISSDAKASEFRSRMASRGRRADDALSRLKADLGKSDDSGHSVDHETGEDRQIINRNDSL